MSNPMQDNTPQKRKPLKRYVFGAIFLEEKNLWLMEGTYPGLVVEALTLPALLEKAAWAIRGIEDAQKKTMHAEMQAH